MNKKIRRNFMRVSIDVCNITPSVYKKVLFLRIS